MATYLKQIASLFASDFWACGRPPRRGENVKKLFVWSVAKPVVEDLEHVVDLFALLTYR